MSFFIHQTENTSLDEVADLVEDIGVEALR